ncbi:MAG: AMP-binding protein [Phycisphaerae bacterium]|nr:AMP-binding protein [Phycisphaerae bacterium]
MISRLFWRAVRSLLALRYRVRTRGLEDILARGRSGILFLPTHPALIDPIIMMSQLVSRFAPRALADRDQIDRFVIRWFARRLGVRPIPVADRLGVASGRQIRQMLAETIAGLAHGENALLYPAGHLLHSRLENLGGNSAVEMILRSVPDVRVVLVRTRGLWGSSFSYANTPELHMGRILRKGALSLLASGIFFAPRRRVDIEFVEPADLPRTTDRSVLNRYLERFYNEGAPPNTYVPRTIWDRRGMRELPEPDARAGAGEGAVVVPSATRELVVAHLAELSGRAEVRDEDRLANELGLDSLARTELSVWLEKEFGFPQGGPEALRTVGDVMLAAAGEAVSAGGAKVQPPAKRWFAGRGSRPVTVPAGDTITSVFLRQVARGPDRVAVADQASGPKGKTYRDLTIAILALQPIIRKLPGDYIGIMLPASVAADMVFLSVLFAGKTPVMVNWTAGARNMLHSLDLLGVRHVLTADALVRRLDADGVDLAGLRERFLPLEAVAGRISRRAKLAAAIRARLSWRRLEKATPPANAVVLFTSGSESLPKAVPLSHANLLTNIRDITAFIRIYDSDRLLGMLPPFHSMGLTVTTLLPLLAGAAVVHSPNPTDGATLAQLVAAYKTTLVVGTPTFLGGIVRAADPGQLASIRAAVTGAEKCSPAVYAAIARICPQARVVEGYGITECSPVVSGNDYDAPRSGTIGKMLPSVKWAVVDVESGQPVPPGKTGVLLLRGPTIFAGYLNYTGPSPFVEFAGESWYRTGDLVHYDADGVFTFDGRLKRFAKLGGEMISLPAIEEVLSARWSPPDGQDGPVLAVEATPTDEHPEIVLFTTQPISREEANAALRAAGLSALHNIRRVIRVDAIPVLGTGKTDYRALREQLKN